MRYCYPLPQHRPSGGTLQLNRIWSTLVLWVRSDAIALIILHMINNALCAYIGSRTSIRSSLMFKLFGMGAAHACLKRTRLSDADCQDISISIAFFFL